MHRRRSAWRRRKRAASKAPTGMQMRAQMPPELLIFEGTKDLKVGELGVSIGGISLSNGITEYQASYLGVYRVQTEKVNGHPAWRHIVHPDRWVVRSRGSGNWVATIESDIEEAKELNKNESCAMVLRGSDADLFPHHSVKTWEVYNRAEKAWQKESALRCRQLDEIPKGTHSLGMELPASMRDVATGGGGQQSKLSQREGYFELEHEAYAGVALSVSSGDVRVALSRRKARTSGQRVSGVAEGWARHR